MNMKMFKNVGLIAAVCMVLVILIILPWAESQLYDYKMDKIENEVEILVTWKERISYGKTYQYHYYLIFGELEDGTPCVVQNANAPRRNKYNGSDLYQQIDVGKVYTFFTTGEREPKRARYPNIIKILDKKETWTNSN